MWSGVLGRVVWEWFDLVVCCCCCCVCACVFWWYDFRGSALCCGVCAGYGVLRRRARRDRWRGVVVWRLGFGIGMFA